MVKFVVKNPRGICSNNENIEVSGQRKMVRRKNKTEVDRSCKKDTSTERKSTKPKNVENENSIADPKQAKKE